MQNTIQSNIIDQGFDLLLYGMGTVFVFLTILVLATGLMSTLVNRFAPAPDNSNTTNANTSRTTTPAGHHGQPSEQVVEAIKRAIAAHRQR